MKLKATEFLALLLIALVMGVFWGTWFTLTRSLENFTPSEFLHIGKTIIANVAMPMRILMPATLLVMLLAIIQSCKANLRRCWYAAFGFVLSVPTTEHVITSGSELEIRPELAEGLSIPV